MRYIRQITFGAVLILLFALSLPAQRPPAANTDLTPEQWREDLTFLAETMPKTHRNLFHSMTREEYEAAVRRLHEQIPSMEDHEVIVGLMRIIAMVRDGHTRLRLEQAPSPSGVFPIRYYWYTDGIYVQAAAPEYSDLVGGRVTGIGTKTTEQAADSLRQVAWADNEMGVMTIVPSLLSIPEILHALKIADGLEEITITVEKSGRTITKRIESTGNLFDLFQAPAEWVDALQGEAPLWLSDPRNNFWMRYLEGDKTLYVQFNAVQNKDDETVADFFGRVFEFIEKNPVDKLAIDLRNNGGGNNFLNRPIVIGLIRSRINKPGKVFGIIGRRTFSAAQNAVNEFEKWTEMTFVGEPTGSRPNHYGDATDITLPNSKLKVRVSTLWWQDLDPRDDRVWTAPDIAAEMTAEDYANGRDPALQAVVNYKPGTGISGLMEELSETQDLGKFLEKYRAFKADPKNKYVDTESAMNSLGYQLLRARLVDPAIEIFKLNVEAYPESSNVYDSLAEAYMIKGEKQKAIEFYERSLSLDPGNSNAVEKLKTLRQKE